MDKNNKQQAPIEPSDEAPFEKKPPLFRWTLSKPAKTIEYVLQNQPEEFIHRHFMLAGLTFVLATRVPDWLATTAHPIGVMIQVLFLGPIMGILLGYIFSACTRNIAQWFDVLIDKRAMRAVTAWTNFPFAMSYLAFLLTYLAAYFLRPGTEKERILMDGVHGWVPLVVLGITFCYALFLRWSTIHILFRVSYPKAVLIWLLAFVITYGPAIVIGITYLAIYTGSMEWMIKT